MPKHAGGALLGIPDLDRSSRLPLFRQLDNRIRQAILFGHLPLIPAGPGDEARTVRRHGSRLSRRGKRLSACADRPTPGTSPFSPNQPAYEEFPFTKWSRLWSRCWRRPARDMLNYGDPLGCEPLQREIALYLADARGMRCEPSQVIIVSGAQKAVGLAAMVLLDPGDTVWMEDPGYVTMREPMRAYGARVAAVPVDQDGLDVKSGIAMAPTARMAVVTPSRQYPLGVPLGFHRQAGRSGAQAESQSHPFSWCIRAQ